MPNVFGTKFQAQPTIQPQQRAPQNSPAQIVKGPTPRGQPSPIPQHPTQSQHVPPPAPENPKHPDQAPVEKKYTDGVYAGKTQREVDAMTDDQRKACRKQYFLTHALDWGPFEHKSIKQINAMSPREQDRCFDHYESTQI